PKTKREPIKTGYYRSYTTLQIQELLDLVLEQGLSARQTEFIVGIIKRTLQHYVKQYEVNVNQQLSSRTSHVIGNNRKLKSVHISFKPLKANTKTK
ncbi:MAG: hypothetical protein EXX96DRAFT_485495, partial [Benjaminiella poitrasii]